MQIVMGVTGGIAAYKACEVVSRLKKLGKDHINVTIGSALDLFGGKMAFTEVLKACGA